MIDNLIAAAIEFKPMTELPLLSNWSPGSSFSGSPSDVVNALFSLSIKIGAMVAVFMFIWGGILLITSRDDTTKIQVGHKKMENAIIGLLMLLSTYVVLHTINPQITSITF